MRDDLRRQVKLRHAVERGGHVVEELEYAVRQSGIGITGAIVSPTG